MKRVGALRMPKELRVVTAYPDHRSFFTYSGKRSMVVRQEFYRKMNLLVRVYDDDLETATPAISQSANPL